MKHIYEHNGVLLDVEYEPATDASGPYFKGIHVMDVDYRPIGPDLRPLLMHVVITDAFVDADGIGTGEPLLSIITGELHGS